MDNPKVSKVKIELQIDFTDPVEGADKVMQETSEALQKLLQERGLYFDGEKASVEITTIDFRESGNLALTWQLTTSLSED
jgi:hypothetical protein